ncbi:Kazal peptide Pr13a-like [Rhodnius prolixus]|uniref:Putative kazal-type serine protease inhibitor n=1 Tax=Rhodnius prolixus TaxID=13249 RepID=R4G7P1_RHOPR
MKTILICLFIIGIQLISLSESKCKCDCTKYEPKIVCGKDFKDGKEETFMNVCQLQCFNCTHGKNYVVIHSGSC